MKVSPGTSSSLGAKLDSNGVNFALYSRHASEVILSLFDSREARFPFTEIKLDPDVHRTGDIWHIYVEGLKKGQLYCFRVKGPRSVKEGHRFNFKAFLLDPYARAIADLHGLPKAVVVPDDFDWKGVSRPKTPLKDSIILETHIRGLTIHPSANSKCPGTYMGVVEKIPYFKDLGITALEFLPVMEFNHMERLRTNPVDGRPLGNYWGYSTIAFFAPKASYSSSGDCGQQVAEFKEMVRELHLAGIEVILDVVFNHTAEMDARGPLYNFRGIDNKSYYLLQKNKSRYQNLTGCGNTFYCNQAAAATLIVDSLKYWYGEMGVDGFRFDLATIFNRGRKGEWMNASPLLEWINNEPSLSEAKLIAEPWDAAGGYAVGGFGGKKWSDWNDKFRDDIRRYWRSDKGCVGKLATRLAGSQDVFHAKGSPLKSINFITCHDGFTLRDLVSYKSKHNRLNGDDNCDGAGENFSSNCGVEGDTDDKKISTLRIKLAKNFIATLLLSQGVPMLLGGDEFFRTQSGNNNAYCQDNEISWYDWNLLKKYSELHRFVKGVIKIRKTFPSLTRTVFFKGGSIKSGPVPDIIWFSDKGVVKKWDEPDESLACFIDGSPRSTGVKKDCPALFIIFNPAKTGAFFIIPELEKPRFWKRLIDTSQARPKDITLNGKSPVITSRIITVGPQSMIVLAEKITSLP